MASLLRAPAVASALLAVVGLAACGGDDGATNPEQDGAATAEPKLTRAQWDSVQLGTKRDEVTDRFGEPPVKPTGSGRFTTFGYSTTDPDSTVTFTFGGDTDGLEAKTWSEETPVRKPISLADFRRMKNGMTQKQVERALGVPDDRSDHVARSPGPSGQAPGTLEHCIHYMWGPNPTYEAEFCFDRAGKLFYKYGYGA